MRGSAIVGMWKALTFPSKEAKACSQKQGILKYLRSEWYPRQTFYALILPPLHSFRTLNYRYNINVLTCPMPGEGIDNIIIYYMSKMSYFQMLAYYVTYIQTSQEIHTYDTDYIALLIPTSGSIKENLNPGPSFGNQWKFF